MKIESIRLKNFKAFRDVHLKDIPTFLVVVGANGSGKSTLFDVFGFLHAGSITSPRTGFAGPSRIPCYVHCLTRLARLD